MNKKKFTLIAGVLILAVLIAAAGCAVSPQQAINKTKKAMLDIESMHMNGKASTTTKYKGQDINAGLTFDGDFTGLNTMDKGNFSMENELTIGMGGISLLFGIDMRMIGDTLYIQASKLPGAIPFLKGKFAEIMTAIQGKWLKLDMTSLRQQSKMDEKALADLKSRITDEYMKSTLYNDIKVLEKEKIDDAPCYHYMVTIDKGKLSSFLEKVNNIKIEWMKKNSGDPEEIEKLEEDADKIKNRLTKTGDIVMELWIDEKDFYLRKLKTVITLAPSPAMEPMKVPVELTFANFNKPVTLVEPGDAKTLPEFIADVVKATGGKMPSIHFPFPKDKMPFDIDNAPIPDNFFQAPDKQGQTAL
ncbi:MAG: hypothetical protein M1269_07790 [Chloroflexi bacterium]|nr:hypothetical protein [Chloroflexota bacterium]